MARKKKEAAVKEEKKEKEVIAATETDGGIGEEVEITELELAKDVEVDG